MQQIFYLIHFWWVKFVSDKISCQIICSNFFTQTFWLDLGATNFWRFWKDKLFPLTNCVMQLGFVVATNLFDSTQFFDLANLFNSTNFVLTNKFSPRNRKTQEKKVVHNFTRLCLLEKCISPNSLNCRRSKVVRGHF